MSKYDAMHPTLKPTIPFSQLYEVKSFFEKVVSYSMGDSLYFKDGKDALVFDIDDSKPQPLVLRVRPATYLEATRVKPFNHLIEGKGFYYAGVGGVCRRGISYTALKSNHYITIPIDEYFAGNTYLYSMAEGVKGKVSRSPLMVYSNELEAIKPSNEYTLWPSYVLPSSEHWDSLFEAIYKELLSLLERDDEVVRINIGMCYLLCPFYYVTIVLDYAVREVCGWAEGFYSYILNENYEKLLKNCRPILNQASSKLRDIFSLVYSSGPEQVVKFNTKYRIAINSYMAAMLSSKYNVNLALQNQKARMA